MGLDMYCNSISTKAFIDDLTLVDYSDDFVKEEVMYWRKNNALHSWMQNLYNTKGGTDEDFNCCIVRLNIEDILKLKDDIVNNYLVPKEGFFFGRQVYSEEMQSEDLTFCDNALDILSKGNALYYYAWY